MKSGKTGGRGEWRAFRQIHFAAGEMQHFAYVAGRRFDRHISMHRGDIRDLRFGPNQSQQQSQGVIDASVRVDDNPLHAEGFLFRRRRVGGGRRRSSRRCGRGPVGESAAVAQRDRNENAARFAGYLRMAIDRDLIARFHDR